MPHAHLPSPTRLGLASALVCVALLVMLPTAEGGGADARAAVRPSASAASSTATPGASSSTLESAAAKASNTGRKVAMSLIALGFAIAAVVLTFKRDFKEAAGVFAVGIVAVLLATPAGLNLLRSTVASLFGGQ